MSITKHLICQKLKQAGEERGPAEPLMQARPPTAWPNLLHSLKDSQAASAFTRSLVSCSIMRLLSVMNSTGFMDCTVYLILT